MKINLMPNKEKAKEKAGFLEDSLKVLFELFAKVVKIIWNYLKKAIKVFIKEYL